MPTPSATKVVGDSDQVIIQWALLRGVLILAFEIIFGQVVIQDVSRNIEVFQGEVNHTERLKNNYMLNF